MRNLEMGKEFGILRKFCRSFGIVLLLLASSLLVACTDVSGGVTPIGSTPSVGGDNLGATAGGVQDFKIARNIVADGKLPPLDVLVTEGIFSEYDLPLTGATCEKLLCLRGGLGFAPDEHNTNSTWMQIAMSSNLTPATLVRPNLSLVFVVDVSGSMNAPSNNTSAITALDVAKEMIRKIVPQLGESDEVAIVTFGSQARTIMGFTAGDQHAEILEATNKLSARGSTAMEAGLKKGYSLIQDASFASKRVMLFSDEDANVGSTGYSAFKNIVDSNPNDIGLTLFGIGNNLRTDTYTLLSTARGGNAFTLYDKADVAKVMEENWPYLAYPLAYDLKLRILPSKGFNFVEAYGFPAADGAGNYTQEVSTVFLSQNRGATLIRLVPQNENFEKFDISAVLTYETAGDRKLESETINLSMARADFDGQASYFEQDSVEKTVILATYVEGIRHAIESYVGYSGYYDRHALELQHSPSTLPRPPYNPSKAIEEMGDVVASITKAATKYDEFDREVKLASDILKLMENQAPVANNYSNY